MLVDTNELGSQICSGYNVLLIRISSDLVPWQTYVSSRLTIESSTCRKKNAQAEFLKPYSNEDLRDQTEMPFNKLE
ncbi:hypothetical protein G6F42_019852 [Rhizopus arrhizus]|nr:hypothetical protein G6F42_019852 [Rhizopus arrhizus]